MNKSRTNGSALPLIKNKISLTSNVKERAELIGCLVETCRINGDNNALADVCKYVATQHKNDDVTVPYCFLKAIKDCYKLSNLNEQSWKCIIEIVQKIVSKKIYSFYYEQWIFEYFNFLVTHDLPFKEYAAEIPKNANMWCSYIKSKKCLEKFGDIVTDLFTEDQLGQYIQYYEKVILWNRNHPADQIHLPCKKIIKIVTDYFDQKTPLSHSYVCTHILEKLLCLDIDESDLELCLKTIVEQQYHCIDMNVLNYLIKYKPLIVLNHVEYVTKIILGMWYTLVKPHFWMFSRNYTHLEIPQKIINICLNAITAEGEASKKNAITALSRLMNNSDFINLIKPYYPDDSRMEVDDNNEEVYKLQQAITASLKYVIPSSAILESVLNFSKGDYMKFIQRALHSVSHSTNEDKLVEFYNALVDRPVSVRKNVVYLTYKVLDYKEICAMLDQFQPTEKNESIHKFIFKASFNYFLKNPSDSSWELVQNHIKRVNTSDEEIVDILIQIKKIPPEFLNTYLVFAFRYLENIPIKSRKVNEGKINLINGITQAVIMTLPEEFSWGIIQTYLFQDKDLSEAVQLLACRFGIYVEGDVEERTVSVFNFIQQYITNTWYSEKGRVEGRKRTNEFITRFCDTFINDKFAPKHTLIKFCDLWNAFLQPHQAFAEYVQLQLTLLYTDCLNLNCDQIATKLCSVCKTLEVYDTTISTELGIILEPFLSSLLKHIDEIPEIKQLNLISYMIQSEIKICVLAAIGLLPTQLPDLHSVLLQYEKIIKQLETIDDQTIKFALSVHFNKQSLTTSLENGRYESQYYSYRGPFRFLQDYTNKYRQLGQYD